MSVMHLAAGHLGHPMRPKLTAVVAVKIRLSAYWRALPLWRCSAPRYAKRRRDADPDNCKRSRSLFLLGRFDLSLRRLRDEFVLLAEVTSCQVCLVMG
jgi:hypothetical protein